MSDAESDDNDMPKPVTGTRAQLVRTSKLLSLILRHQPEAVGVQLDSQGWLAVDELLTAAAAHGHNMSHAMLIEVVRTSDKQRFALSPDGRRIRANQGHSIAVDLKLTRRKPPQRLFHGTATRFLSAIMATGLRSMDRLHVHLSPTRQRAMAVGHRHGKPVVLTVQSGQMHSEGFEFFCSDNDVWLTDAVPARFLDEPKDVPPTRSNCAG